MSRSLVDKARDYLEANKGSWPQICEDTGLDYSWLCKFAVGKIDDPSVRKIETLLGNKSTYRIRKKRGQK